jgi:hypothetical protein
MEFRKQVKGCDYLLSNNEQYMVKEEILSSYSDVLVHRPPVPNHKNKCKKQVFVDKIIEKSHFL